MSFSCWNNQSTIESMLYFKTGQNEQHGWPTVKHFHEHNNLKEYNSQTWSLADTYLDSERK